MNKALFLVISLQTFTLFGQDPTLGLIVNEEDSFNGYTLFSPSIQYRTYLIDNCGEVVHMWEAQTRIGGSEYLLEDGSLIRCARVNGNFSGGGITGRIERYNWEGELIWSYEYADINHHLHHDIEVLPNGNILMIAWERKNQFEAMENGKTNNISQHGLWPGMVIEVQPMGIDSGEIVWEWHAWDHMIQDVDPGLLNFGQISENPNRININFQSNYSDWIHFNAIDYNADLDQIVLSSRHWSEFWIIDHSTTTAEAATSEGGIYGMGGDLLYRWGNPIAYNSGDEQDQKLFGQHDVRWIESEFRYGGLIMMFNNGVDHSSIGVMEPPINDIGSYVLNKNGSFGPEEFSYEYDGGSDNSFFSSRISGAEILENGNILICEGRNGRFFEVNEDEQKVWEYINPDSGIIFSQGQFATGNSVFRTTRYRPDYSAFEGRDLEPVGPIEIDPIANGCSIYSSTKQIPSVHQFNIYPTLIENEFVLSSPRKAVQNISLLDMSGATLYRWSRNAKQSVFDVSSLHNGLYIVQVVSDQQYVQVFKVVKN